MLKTNHSEFILTKRETEFFGLPIGNAFGGAPFKKKEMPFFIAPAIAAIGAATTIATTIGAVVTAIGTVAAVAGTAMTVVGLATGDKELMKIGGIVGLAGGVTALAAGGLTSLAAGGEFAFGSAGVQSAITADAAAAASQATAIGTGGMAAMNTAITPNLANAGANVASSAGATTEGLGGAGFSGIQGGTGLVGGAGTLQAGSGVAGASVISPAFSGAVTIGNVGTEAAGAGFAGIHGGTGLVGGGGNAISGISSTTAANLAKSAASVIPEKVASSAASGGFFSELFGGMTTLEKTVTAKFGLDAVSGIAKAYNENEAQEYKNKIRNQQLDNLNTVAKIDGFFGYDGQGNRVEYGVDGTTGQQTAQQNQQAENGQKTGMLFVAPKFSASNQPQQAVR